MAYSFIAESSTSGQAVVLATYVIGMIWKALVHPKRIRSLTQFRVATFMATFRKDDVYRRWSIQNKTARK